jgi:hypothetical protein
MKNTLIFCSFSQLHENGRYEMGDFTPTAGKTLLALGRLLTGAQVRLQDNLHEHSELSYLNHDITAKIYFTRNHSLSSTYATVKLPILLKRQFTNVIAV